jgi:hypothetical protein
LNPIYQAMSRTDHRFGFTLLLPDLPAGKEDCVWTTDCLTPALLLSGP